MKWTKFNTKEELEKAFFEFAKTIKPELTECPALLDYRGNGYPRCKINPKRYPIYAKFHSCTQLRFPITFIKKYQTLFFVQHVTEDTYLYNEEHFSEIEQTPLKSKGVFAKLFLQSFLENCGFSLEDQERYLLKNPRESNIIRDLEFVMPKYKVNYGTYNKKLIVNCLGDIITLEHNSRQSFEYPDTGEKWKRNKTDFLEVPCDISEKFLEEFSTKSPLTKAYVQNMVDNFFEE